jgi:hypothetical protein
MRMMPPVEAYERMLMDMAADNATAATLAAELVEAIRDFPELVEETAANQSARSLESFKTCTPVPPRPAPSSVDDLTPCDFDVIATLGDSISTGANSASKNLFDLDSFPGIAWSSGGDTHPENAGKLGFAQTPVTLPNLIKRSCGGHEHELYGLSYGRGLGNMNLNYGVNGAVAKDLPGQTKALIQDMKNRLGTDAYNNKWKLVTVLTGGNNLRVACSLCKKKQKENGPEQYAANLKESLELLATVPRTYVNVVGHLQYQELRPYVRGLCRLIIPAMAPCFSFRVLAKRTSSLIDEFNKATQSVIAEVMASKTRTDNALVFQPFALDTKILDKSLVAPDCFHPSAEGQATFAVGLWNNLLEGIGKKSTSVTPEDEPACASSKSILPV